MRTCYGPNRAKETPVAPAPEVSLCVVTHYTDHPWHKDRMDVVRMSLDTLLNGLGGVRTEFILWDNESTPEFRALLRCYPCDVRVESVNVGNWNARRSMLRMARAPVVSLADDDLLYSRDWLPRQLEVLKAYPKVATVSGCPSRMTSKDAPAREFAYGHGNYQEGDLIPKQWESDWFVSRYAKPGEWLGDSLLMEYNGVKAWACGLDMQFLAYAKTIEPFYAHVSPIIIDKSGLTRRISEAGLLQLTTEKRTALHIGNVIDETVRRAYREIC